MTNNQLCDILGGIGLLITFISMVLVFFGEPCWIGIITGFGTMAVSQMCYD